MSEKKPVAGTGGNLYVPFEERTGESSVVFFTRDLSEEGLKKIYDKVFFWCDTMGLAAFTVDGVHTGFFTTFSNNWFLVIFLGVVTGVGGGVLRDVLSLEMPYIFVKHIYAIASIIGATATYLIFLGTGSAASAMLAGFFIVVGIRYLAMHFGWNLPKIDH